MRATCERMSTSSPSESAVGSAIPRLRRGSRCERDRRRRLAHAGRPSLVGGAADDNRSSGACGVTYVNKPRPATRAGAATRTVSWLRSLGGLAAFRHRNYRLFFAGQGISLVGTWMTAVAQSWLLLQLTGNPFDLRLVAAFQFPPVVVLGFFGGLIADALPKRPTRYLTLNVRL